MLEKLWQLATDAADAFQQGKASNHLGNMQVRVSIHGQACASGSLMESICK